MIRKSIDLHRWRLVQSVRSHQCFSFMHKRTNRHTLQLSVDCAHILLHAKSIAFIEIHCKSLSKTKRSLSFWAVQFFDRWMMSNDNIGMLKVKTETLFRLPLNLYRNQIVLYVAIYSMFLSLIYRFWIAPFEIHRSLCLLHKIKRYLWWCGPIGNDSRAGWFDYGTIQSVKFGMGYF